MALVTNHQGLLRILEPFGDLLRVTEVRGERLVTEDVETVIEPRQHLLVVEGVGRADEDRVECGVVEHLPVVVVERVVGDRERGPSSLAAFGVDLGDRAHRRVLVAVELPADERADVTRPDESDPERSVVVCHP